MNLKDREYFEQKMRELRQKIRQAKPTDSNDLADLQAELFELQHDKGVHEYYDSLEA